MGEQPIFTTKAHVFQIDPETKKKWIPVSSQAAVVSFYHDSVRNSYRIISFDQANKVLVNSTLLPNMSFAKTSQKFGQWADHRVNTIYGLGFNSELELIQFMDKFNEVKELVKMPVQSSTVDKTSAIANGSERPSVVSSSTPSVSQSYNSYQQPTSESPSHPPSSVPTAAATAAAAAAAAVTANNQLVEQLKSDNERLKLALAQSSTNAKKWEQDLQTLRSNNSRLTAALTESNTNVEEWKKQLAAYKEENTRLKLKLSDIEKNSGNVDVLQRQIIDNKGRLEETERLVQKKEEEVNDLRRKLDEKEQVNVQVQRLTAKLQTMEDEKLKMRKQITELQQQLEQAQSTSLSGRQQLLGAQQQISAKINELYEMNDKLADLLQSTNLG